MTLKKSLLTGFLLLTALTPAKRVLAQDGKAPTTPAMSVPPTASPDAVAAAQPAKDPALPPTINTLAQQGAQVRYLGRQHGLDGWITVKNGQTQYFYAPPDQSYLMMGLLFDPDGKLVTVRQIKELQDKSGGGLDSLAGAPQTQAAAAPGIAPAMTQFKTPAEQLYDNVSNANTITLGANAAAPALYAFIDPQCPHCQAFLKEAKPSLDSGKLQIHAIPIGFIEQTVAEAAYLLAAPDAPDRLFKFINGDKTAIPVTPGISEQGVERNLAIMQSWKFDVTPMIIYRDGTGHVKIVRGKPKDLATLLADLQKKT